MAASALAAGGELSALLDSAKRAAELALELVSAALAVPAGWVLWLVKLAATAADET